MWVAYVEESFGFEGNSIWVSTQHELFRGTYRECQKYRKGKRHVRLMRAEEFDE